MLVLSRKVGEEVVIGGNVRLTVVAIRGNQVRLGFTAPRETPIRRKELPRTLDGSTLLPPGEAGKLIPKPCRKRLEADEP
jgi:carbon storage regulator